MTTIPGAISVARPTQDALNVIRNQYQDKMFEDAKKLRMEGIMRILLQAPPASGKSYVGIRFIRAADRKNKTIFYVSPRKNLVLDMHKKMQHTGIRYGFKMSECGKDMLANVQLCCTPSLLNECRDNPYRPHADMLVIDEAHVEQESIVELVSYYPDATIILMTGTPLPGMDRYVDAVVKGPTMEFLTNNGLLTPIKYEPLLKENRPASLSGKKADKMLGEVVSTWLRLGRNLPTVLFASSVAASMKLVDRFNECGVPAVHMDAFTLNDDRKKIFDGLENGTYKVVGTVGTYSYGVDVPAVSCAILAYTVEKKIKNSPETLADYVQKISRIIRTCDGKEIAVVLDHSGLYDEFGMIEVEREWYIDSVDGKEKLEKENERVSRIVECKSCGAKFESNFGECPACHEPIKVNRSSNLEHIDVQLGGVVGPDGKLQKTQPTDAECRRFYEDAVRICKEKGWREGKAYYLFIKRFPGRQTPAIRLVSGGSILPENRALLTAYLDNERKAYHAKRRGDERAVQRREEKGVASAPKGA